MQDLQQEPNVFQIIVKRNQDDGVQLGAIPQVEIGEPHAFIAKVKLSICNKLN